MKRIRKMLVIMSIFEMFLFANNLEIQAEEYEYDMLNRVTKVTYEDGSYVEYEYDKNGNIVNIYVHEAAAEEEDKTKDENKPSAGGNDTAEEGKTETGEKPTDGEKDTAGEGETGAEDKPLVEGSDTTGEGKIEEDGKPSVDGTDEKGNLEEDKTSTGEEDSIIDEETGDNQNHIDESTKTDVDSNNTDKSHDANGLKEILVAIIDVFNSIIQSLGDCLKAIFN